MEKRAKLKKCKIGTMSDVFLRDQFKELDYNFTTALKSASQQEENAFYRFAAALGCFSREHFIGEDGKPMAATIGQIASSTLRKLMKDNGTRKMGYQNARLRIGDFAELVADLPKNVTPNQDFLQFLRYSTTDVNGMLRYPNLELLLKMERGYVETLVTSVTDETQPPVEITHQARPGLFAKVMSNFEIAQNFNVILTEYGLQRVTQDVAFRRFYQTDFDRTYRNENARNHELGDLFRKCGFQQDYFDKVAAVYQVAAANHVPHHILGKPLAEPQGSHPFTFEMLDKYDPHNAIIGMLTSCCAYVGSLLYGGSIAEVAITEPDVQNMVVRNGRGEIIAKGALHLNREKSAGVFNSFEISNEYQGRSHKKQNMTHEIYQAFKRGAQAVAARYNTLYPKSPLQKITTGVNYLHHNEILKRDFPLLQVDQKVISDYFFNDANAGYQCLIYQAPSRVLVDENTDSDDLAATMER